MTGSFLWLALTSISAAPLEDDGSKALEGRWNHVSIRSNGAALLRLAPGARFFFEDGAYAASRHYQISEEGEFRIDPSKNPMEIDFWIKRDDGQTFLKQGIYHLDGQSLKLCFTANQGELRPKNFEDKRGAHQEIHVLVRLKD